MGLLTCCCTDQILRFLKWSDQKVPFWDLQDWLRTTPTDEELTLAIDPSLVPLALNPIVQLYDRRHFLRAEYELVPTPSSRLRGTQIEEQEALVNTAVSQANLLNNRPIIAWEEEKTDGN